MNVEGGKTLKLSETSKIVLKWESAEKHERRELLASKLGGRKRSVYP